MKNCLITISFKQIIDGSMQGWFEKGVINSSYEEFLLKSQLYNPELKFKTFQEMKTNNPKADSLNYKCGFPVIPFVDLLKNEIPGLKNTIDEPIKFKTHLFQIIDSDITNRLAHTVSITYFTEQLSLIDSFGEYLLLAYGNKFAEHESKPIEDTFLLKVGELISVSNYQSIKLELIN
jgi:hypothetical protein